MSSCTEKCPTLLLSDIPGESDKFGSHEPIANAIADMIMCEQGGKTVAIEGGWGSGKSTVVSLLEKKLHTIKDTKAIIFNAWAHEGDPLRRTFLETIIIALQKDKWIDKGESDKRLAGLAMRRKVTDITSSSVLTPGGWLLAISVFLLPIGIGVINGLLGTLLGGKWGDMTPIQFKWIWFAERLGITICLLPIILALVLTGYRMIQYYKKHKKIKFEFPILIDKAEQTVHSEAIETPEPTSVEFEKIFSEIMSEALNNTKHNRRLIIIIDNLDRISTTDALAVLSSLRTFLEHNNDNGQEYLPKLWVIIPYDEDSLSTIWSNGDFTQHRDKRQNYLDKIFQVKFRVPPLVLSNWKQFMDESFAHVFPKHSLDEFHLVYRIFESSGKSPTPREIILFANAIGSLHRLWEDKIPLYQLAYFVLHSKKTIIEIINQRLSETWEIKSIFDDDSTSNLAALYYNVKPEIAVQILLNERIKKSIETCNPKALDDLMRLSPKGFWGAFEHSITMLLEEWSGNEKYKIAYTASTIMKSEIAKNSERPEVKTVYDMIKKRTTGIVFERFTLQIAEGLYELCLLQDKNEDYAKQLIRSIPSLEPEQTTSLQPVQDDEISEWVGAFYEILSQLDSIKLSNVYKDGINVTSDPNTFFRACAILDSIDGSSIYWKYFVTSAEDSTLSQTIKQIVESGKIQPAHILALKILSVSGKFVNNIQQNISLRIQNASCPSPEIFNLLEFLKLTSYAGEFDNLRKTFVLQGNILHHFYQAWNQQNFITTASCMFEHLLNSPSGSVNTHFGNSSNGSAQLNIIFGGSMNNHEIFDKFIDLIVEYKTYDLLFKILDSNINYKPGVWACLSRVVNLSIKQNIFTPKIVYSHWEILSREWPSFSDILPDLVNDDEFINLIQNDEFNISRLDLYKKLLDPIETADPGFIIWCKEAIGKIPEQDWYNYLKQEHNLLSFTVDLALKDSLFKLDLFFKNALLQHAKDVLYNNLIPQKYKEQWGQIISLLNGTMLQNLKKDLIETVVGFNYYNNTNGASLDAFLDIYGSLINDVVELKKNTKTVSGILIPFIKNNNSYTLDWIKTLSSSSDIDAILNEEDAKLIELKETILQILNNESITKKYGKSLNLVLQKIEIKLGYKDEKNLG